MLLKTLMKMNNINANNLEKAEELMDKLTQRNVKVLKKEKGLIERVEDRDKKVIIVEDNRQLICE